MDSSENDEAQEKRISPSDEPQAEREIDLADEEGFPPYVPAAPPSDTPEGTPGIPAEDAYDQPFPDDRPPLEGGMGEPDSWVSSAPVLAEPGIYVCIMENAGEHGLLGRLDFGEEYDYSHENNPEKLAAIAACVEGRLLEKKA